MALPVAMLLNHLIIVTMKITTYPREITMHGGYSGERPSEVLKIGPSTFIVEKLPDRPYGPTGSIDFSEFIRDTYKDVTITGREFLNCGEPRRIEYEVTALMTVEEVEIMTPVDCDTQEQWKADFGKAPIKLDSDCVVGFSKGHVVNRVMDNVFNVQLSISPHRGSVVQLAPPGISICSSPMYERTFAVLAVFRVGQILGVTE